ncbi:MAG: hypothetical protein ACRERD_33720 [Candidatus Binatia bacterium]
MRRLLLLSAFLLLFGPGLPAIIEAQPRSALDVPGPGSVQSGVGLIHGWVCDATLVDIEVGGQRFRAGYGVSRADTRNRCGDDNNGFGLAFNWNELAAGTHRVRAFADNQQFADVMFTVTTFLGGGFERGLSGECTVPNFPQMGDHTTVAWEESLQNFVIVSGRREGGGNSGIGMVDYLDVPGPGSTQSGIGLIHGWVCDATLVEIQVDDGPRLRTGYGASRIDTQHVCRDDGNNGFALPFNWNLLGDGLHRVRAFADNQQFADVTFTVTPLGEEFSSGVSGECTVEDFPEMGGHTTVAWDQSLQNFVITRVEGQSGLAASPMLLVEPNLLVFTSTIRDRQFTVTNTGGGTLVVHSITLASGSSSVYSIGELASFSLAPGQVMNVSVHSGEDSSLERGCLIPPCGGGTAPNGTVIINSNGGTATVELSG